MAQQTQIILVDDIDGGPADETVAFGLDNTQYEVDLTSANAAKLRDALAPYVAVARRAGRRPTRGAGRRSAAGSAGGRGDAGQIRAWAKAHGHKVSERGRISAEVREAWEAAH